jgi:osmotically-inducible protein OsmY
MNSAQARWLPLLMAAATVTVSCTAASPRPSAPPGAESARSEQRAADEALANAVYSALNADPIYFYRHVEVNVSDGVANLSGYVWSTDAIYRARDIARGVPGVTRVETNHLELERNGPSNGAVTR